MRARFIELDAGVRLAGMGRNRYAGVDLSRVKTPARPRRIAVRGWELQEFSCDIKMAPSLSDHLDPRVAVDSLVERTL